ncbi:MAG TPA: NAD-dependent deacylase [Paludibacteraceae bacterium]|nr:NAD-dependent deacylase [Paludibacteraceae bacterium]HOU69451.1 NAD-dependent deacylase [Paludibacteraceae bacterium]HPH62879.1 NAD-dependent deacylase [Paludibacteraceae bacterium]HQF50440.1 NAD-dependent deacylase [Paludibacteraceae bacterium]
MKKLIVLTGAGISAESGISTFRDSDGLWEHYRVEDVATVEGFERNPKLVLDFYNQRRRDTLACKPNYGHVGLVELEKYFEVDIITQNIDNLHERAGSTSVLHLHGELMKARSSKNEDLIVDLPEDKDIQLGDKAPDGSQLRPFIVWFGESVPNITQAISLVEDADVFLIVGTSLNVYPAASLVNYVRRGSPIYLIDPKSVVVPDNRNLTVFQMGASEGMKKFVSEMKTKYRLE